MQTAVDDSGVALANTSPALVNEKGQGQLELEAQKVRVAPALRTFS
ncbi:MAG: hypothetical protein Q4C87_06985 [Actinomycetaceae bacterium]|nr:hypothetical protein [Actinomycetaceae bacterium]